jgi:hypothetical protein
MQTARHSNESTRRVRWSNTQVLWAHSGGGEQDACKYSMIPLSRRALLGICDSLRCLWVGYGAYWSVDIHLEFQRGSGVLSLGGRANGRPVAGTFSYFVFEGKCVAMFMSLACCWRSSAPRASHRVPCSAC